MPWLFRLPGHQQSWYWLSPCLTWGRISTTYVMSVRRNDRKYKFMFVLKNFARKELMYWHFDVSSAARVHSPGHHVFGHPVSSQVRYGKNCCVCAGHTAAAGACRWTGKQMENAWFQTNMINSLRPSDAYMRPRSRPSLVPTRRQAIIWTNAGILWFGPFWTNLSEILIEICTF